MRAGLAERLKNETSGLHVQAERAGIIPDLLGGRLERDIYCLLLGNLHGIYAALEPALARHAAHPFISPVWVPGLRRLDALAEDLRVLHGTGWAVDLRLEPACLQYAGRLHEIDGSHPELLAAHAYVRYLGDLSGGQMLGRIVSRAYNLGNGSGVRFYAFGEPGAANLARRLREGLDALPADDAVADAIVAEAKLAFDLHIRLFDELALRRTGPRIPAASH